MPYDNTTYWKKLHKQFKGELKAVGRSSLSESFNRLKYNSETEALRESLQTIISWFTEMNKESIPYLDIGAGTGYWTSYIHEVLTDSGFKPSTSALDISEDALEIVQKKYPYIHVLREDLKTVDQNNHKQLFDLVSAFYCFNHITNIEDYLNAIRFAGNSVNNDGFLLIMDPILTKAYSRFDTIDFQNYQRHSIPRHLHILDDVLVRYGLKRMSLRPAISFVLNGCIESSAALSYFFMDLMWRLLVRFYSSDQLVQKASRILMSVDSFLKKQELAFSSSICVYRKEK